ncbi:MAG: hypothetical protein OHK0046_44200 [Anaerolineae bacterium]
MKDVPLALKPPDPSVRIRPVKLSDVGALHAACWADRPPISTHQLVARAQQSARQGRGLGVVVIKDGPEDIRGYGQLTLWSRSAEISDLMIVEMDRGCGYGTAIIQYLVRTAREMHAPAVEIGAAVSNPGALALYRRLGFQDDHELMLNLGQGPEPVIYLRLPF